MKIAPILRQMDLNGIRSTLIHTGQHYDSNLSDIFFAELGIKRPEFSLSVGSGTHAKQTADVMVGIEKVLIDLKTSVEPIELLVVVGDVNSTMAASIAAAKLQIPVAHVEAGLRSFDRTMPEEINRLLTDSISDLLFVSEPEGVANLLREGHAKTHIHLVGNVMIDTLKTQLASAQATHTLEELALSPGSFGVVTLHRPSNVDSIVILTDLLDVLLTVAEKIPLVFPIHPRTRSRMNEFGLSRKLIENVNVRVVEPLGYLEFLCLTSQAKVIVTDSGGLQEESTALSVPCLTLRENTERPITCSEGTSTLIGNSADKLRLHLDEVLTGSYKKGNCPELWDGNASARIVSAILSQFKCG